MGLLKAFGLQQKEYSVATHGADMVMTLFLSGQAKYLKI